MLHPATTSHGHNDAERRQGERPVDASDGGAGAEACYVALLIAANDLCAVLPVSLGWIRDLQHRFSASQISTLDYVHPSLSGQAALAQVT